MRRVAELSGRDTAGVIALARTQQGWRVCAEFVEMRRIPGTHDLLALYETEIDGTGELISYRRTKRYARGRAG